MQKLVEEMRGGGEVGGSKKPSDDVRVRLLSEIDREHER